MRHRGLASRLITRQAANAILDNYWNGAITPVESMHRSDSFGAAIFCRAAVAYADAQHAAGESIQVCARLIGKVMGAIAYVDADDEHDEYTGYCA